MREMAAALKLVCLLGLIVLVSIVGLERVDAAGECGKSSPDNEALKLAPCAEAAQDQNAAVSASCCDQVRKIGRSPSCLCAVMLSNTAKASGIKPEIAITIPKRCNIANRPVGYKCGPYTLP
ncbi:Bifunctional inhibitor/plant lipid transfer protein/seed storage helical domain - like 10 [Theobroma cacao]|nr:Bifunctional inhibitor/plant lipid transfer protein/seed storage helical domain - like 10 [Theobroma cacao]